MVILQNFYRATYVTKPPILLPEGCNSPFDSLPMNQKRVEKTELCSAELLASFLLATSKSKLGQLPIAIEVKPHYPIDVTVALML